LGYYEEILEQEIREGNLRERGGAHTPVEYVDVPTPLAKESSESTEPLNSGFAELFTKMTLHDDSELPPEQLEETIQQFLERIGPMIIQHAAELNLSIEESIVALEIILETMKNAYAQL
jgi:hypothetical protein